MTRKRISIPAGSEPLERAIWVFSDPELVRDHRKAREELSIATQNLRDHNERLRRLPDGERRAQAWNDAVLHEGRQIPRMVLLQSQAAERKTFTERRLDNDFRQKIMDGRLIAWGYSSLEWDTWQRIPPAAAFHLEIIDLRYGTVRDRTDPRRTYSNVYVLDAYSDSHKQRRGGKQFALILDWFQELSEEEQQVWLSDTKKKRGDWQQAEAAIRARYPHQHFGDPARVFRSVVKSLKERVPEK